MPTAFCPQCGNAKSGDLRYCAHCGFDFWKGAAETPQAAPGSVPVPTQPTDQATAAPSRTGRSRAEIAVMLLIAVVVVGGIGYVLLQNRANDIVNDVGNQLNDIGGSANVPPAGTIWFGTSFDPSTMAVSGRTSSVGQNDPFSAVAHLPRAMDGSDLAMRVYFDGQLVTTTAAGGEGSGDIWGWSLGPLFEPGTWRYEVTDLGGNVLASGEIKAAR